MPDRTKTLLKVGVVAILVAVTAIASYWACRTYAAWSKKRAIFQRISSSDAKVAVAALFDAEREFPPGPARHELRGKVKEFLAGDEPRRLRAAIILSVRSELPELRLVNQQGGIERVRRAIERYNKLARYEKITLTEKDGKTSLWFRQHAPRREQRCQEPFSWCLPRGVLTPTTNSPAPDFFPLRVTPFAPQVKPPVGFPTETLPARFSARIA